MVFQDQTADLRNNLGRLAYCLQSVCDDKPRFRISTNHGHASFVILHVFQHALVTVFFFVEENVLPARLGLTADIYMSVEMTFMNSPVYQNR